MATATVNKATNVADTVYTFCETHVPGSKKNFFNKNNLKCQDYPGVNLAGELKEAVQVGNVVKIEGSGQNSPTGNKIPGRFTRTYSLLLTPPFPKTAELITQSFQ